jgi:hypothetical protein
MACSSRWSYSFAALVLVFLPLEPAIAQGAQSDLQRAQALTRAAYVMYQADAPPGNITSGQAGVLLAEGDSWFDYPRWDVLKALRRDGYEVASVAHYGQTLEQIAYDTTQLSGTIAAMKLLKAEGKRPKALLLSAGGNDLAGPELSAILTYHGAGFEPLDSLILREIIDNRLQKAMKTWLLAVTEMSTREFGAKVPILIHGYDYPVPDGRGFLGGFSILPGPWLDPSFRNRAYSSDKSGVEANAGVMHAVIDRFNRMLQAIPVDPQLRHVRYVKVTGTLSDDPGDYKKDWANELHPTGEGFKRVAKQFEEVLVTLQ